MYTNQNLNQFVMLFLIANNYSKLIAYLHAVSPSHTHMHMHAHTRTHSFKDVEGKDHWLQNKFYFAAISFSSAGIINVHTLILTFFNFYCHMRTLWKKFKQSTFNLFMCLYIFLHPLRVKLSKLKKVKNSHYFHLLVYLYF